MEATLVQINESVSSDRQLMELWIYGKSLHTQRYYRREAEKFLQYVEKPLGMVTLADLQQFAKCLSQSGLKPSSQGRSLSAVKSLLTFGHKIGVLPVNVGAAFDKLPSVKDRLNERILTEPQVHTLIALITNRRDRLLLKLLYGAGLRVSELCSLSWRDLTPNGQSGQLNVYGKGGKTRCVLLPESLWVELIELRGNATPDEPIFVSRKKRGHLDPSQVHRIVKKAATAAGIEVCVSAHWLRHAHASHSLDRGCPIHVLQQSMGHSNVATTSRYLHCRPGDSSARYLAI